MAKKNCYEFNKKPRGKTRQGKFFGLTEKKIRIRLFVSGRVQGVFFRRMLADRARKIGADGWVRNLSDGRVEAVLEGKENNVLKLINWLKREPGLVKIDKLKIKKEKKEEKFKGFEIRH